MWKATLYKVDPIQNLSKMPNSVQYWLCISVVDLAYMLSLNGPLKIHSFVHEIYNDCDNIKLPVEKVSWNTYIVYLFIYAMPSREIWNPKTFLHCTEVSNKVTSKYTDFNTAIHLCPINLVWQFLAIIVHPYLPQSQRLEPNPTLSL